MQQQQPPGPANSSRARERYAKRRRRQLAAVTAIGLVAAVLLSALILAVFLIRGCSSLLTGSGPTYKRSSADSRWARPLAAQELKPAPWLVEFDGEHVYAARDTQKREEILTSWPVDQLAAYTLGENQPLWQRTIDAYYSEFYLGSDRLVGFKQSLMEPPYLLLDCFSAADGAQLWSFTLEQAGQGCIAAAGPQVIVGYELPDGYRLASYDLQKRVLSNTGIEAKSWGIRLPMDDLSSEEYGSDIFSELDIRLWSDLVVYKQFNVIGFVEADTGRRLREFAAPMYIHAFTVDPAQRICYIVYTGNQEQTYAVLGVPCIPGSARSVYRFEGQGEDTKLAVQDGSLALAYPLVGDETGKLRSSVRCFRQNDLVLEAEVDGLVRALFTHEQAPGVFFAAVNSGIDDLGYPSGRSVIWRFDLSNGKAAVAARYSRPMMSATPFKDDCLVLLRGGDIYSFSAVTGDTRRLRRARFPILSALASPDAEHIAVFASTEKHYANEPGQPMQVIVFE